MYRSPEPFTLLRSLRRVPAAVAILRGGDRCPSLYGTVRFDKTPMGVLVSVEVMGLPAPENPCESPIFALHLHEGGTCLDEDGEPFGGAGGHYNPHLCPHPYHAGDLPPLCGADGVALSCFLTTRFSVEEVLGKTVILHDSPDDFVTQPAGNAGSRIACGVITPTRRG